MASDTKKMGRPKKDATLSSTERSRRCRANKKYGAAPAGGISPVVTETAVRKRRAKSNTVEVAVKALANASKDAIKPPANVRMYAGADWYFDAIVLSRARDDWIEVDLITAALLANVQAQIAEQELFMDAESIVMLDSQGSNRINPRFTAIELLNKRMTMLMRTLRMGGKAPVDAKTLSSGRVIESNARSTYSEIEDSDGLLA